MTVAVCLVVALRISDLRATDMTEKLKVKGGKWMQVNGRATRLHIGCGACVSERERCIHGPQVRRPSLTIISPLSLARLDRNGE
jgi:hypothetical protein